MLTDAELIEIEQRAEKATEGPWRAEMMAGEPIVVVPSQWSDLTLDDCKFIASSRTDVPALVAEVRRLRKLIWDTGWGIVDYDEAMASLDVEATRIAKEGKP